MESVPDVSKVKLRDGLEVMVGSNDMVSVTFCDNVTERETDPERDSDR